MVSALNANIEERHRFKTVRTDIPIAKKQRLSMDAFQATELTQSLPFEEIANFEAQTEHFSPKSENNNVQMGG